MSKKKEDFGNLIKNLGNKDFKVPTQKVVPITNNETVTDSDTHKLSLRMYIHEFEDLKRFVNYMIIDEKNLSYKMSDAISKGIHLLTENKEIKRGMPKVKLAVGRKAQATEAEIKGTTVIVSTDDMELLNDFIYHKMMSERNTKYSRIDLMAELMDAIRSNYKKVF